MKDKKTERPSLDTGEDDLVAISSDVEGGGPELAGEERLIVEAKQASYIPALMVDC